MTKAEFFKIMDRGHHRSEFTDRSIGSPELVVDFRSPMPIPEFEDDNNTYPIVVEDFSYQIPDGSPLPFRYIIRIPDSWLRHCIAFLEELGTHRAKDNLWMYL